MPALKNLAVWAFKMVVLATVAGVVFGASIRGGKSWVGKVKDERYRSLLSSIRHLHFSGDSEGALDLLDENIQLLKSSDERVAVTEEVELELAVSTRDLPRLARLATSAPELVTSDETASLLWGRTCLHLRDFESYSKLRATWSGRERDTAGWFFLDVDRLLILGDPEAAKALVEERCFEGDEEAKRLVYLALFNSDRPGDAGSLLTEAYRHDPTNTDVRTFAANLFESEGRHRLAQREYVAAYVQARENPVVQDNLAEFYLRRGNVTQALDTWDDGGAGPAFVWVKLFFWAKLCSSPREVLPKIDRGPWEAWAEAAVALPPEKFWSAELEEISSRLEPRARNQEKYFFWLKLVDHLAGDRIGEALSLLRTAPASSKNLAPQLASALYVLLVYHSSGTLLDRSTEIYDGGGDYSHPFFEELSLATREVDPEQVATYLAEPNAIASAFLAAGWLNAACRLSGEASGSEPPWFEYGIAQAFRYSHGNAAAIRYLESVAPTPATTTLLGELCLGEDMIERAISLLESVAVEQTDAGFRASWLLAHTHLASGRLDQASTAVSSHARFSESPRGIEVKARIALARDETEKARALYKQIVDSSLEANVFFSREAFAANRWTEARRYTEEAIELEPNSGRLLENLERIRRADETGTR